MATAPIVPAPSKRRMIPEEEVANELGLKVGTLRRWRLYGRGPTFVKIGGAVRYDRFALERWIATQPTGGDLTGLATSELKKRPQSFSKNFHKISRVSTAKKKNG